MEKPITVARQEFIENIVKLINESGLPPFVISPILKETLSQIDALAQQQYESDLKKWGESDDES